MRINKHIVEFEIALDNLIKSELKDVTEEEIQYHFGSTTISEHIKLVIWSIKE